MAAAAALGVLTLLHAVTPWTLLVFTLILGVGAVMNDPAWQAITPEVVSPGQHASAVALNSAGFNVARAVGPALGGIVVAAAGSGWSFLLNAASFFGVILFLCRWQRAPHEPLATRRVRDAIIEGFRYVRGAPQVRSVLIRTGAFSVGATSLLALLPVICQPHGAQGYGFLLTCFGWELSWRGAAAASAAALFGGRAGGGGNCGICGHDIFWPGRCMHLSGFVRYCLRRARRGSEFWHALMLWRRRCVLRGCGHGHCRCICWCCKAEWRSAAWCGERWRRAKGFQWRWLGRRWQW